MPQQTKITSPLNMLSALEPNTEPVSFNYPQDVLLEVQKTVSLIFQEFDFEPLRQVFQNILKLFSGRYPGYHSCNTSYHDLNHTLDCLLVTAELIHGASVRGVDFGPRLVNLGLTSALMHDTGYIQRSGDDQGSGAKYTLSHINRSIDFMARYFHDHGFTPEDFYLCRNILRCTGLDVKIADLHFQSREHEILGQILGTADLIGQMANENYPEKLHFLYQEFQEGKVPGFENELDFLKKTPEFWEMVQERFVQELGQVDLFLVEHFRVRWGINQNWYRQAIDRNIQRIRELARNFEANRTGSLGPQPNPTLFLSSPA